MKRISDLTCKSQNKCVYLKYCAVLCKGLYKFCLHLAAFVWLVG